MNSTSFAGRPDAIEPPAARRWFALVAIALGQLMLALDATIVNVALPTVERSLGFPAAVRPWMVSAYLLPFAVLLLPGGRLADALGQKRSFLIAALGFAASSALGGGARHWLLLLVARALQGTFAALLAPSALALVALSFREPRERARAFGIYGAVAACGGALGLVLGGSLARFADWRWCLYVNVFFAAFAFAGVGVALEAPARVGVRASPARTLVGLLDDPRRRVALSVAALSVAAMAGSFLLLTYQFQRVRHFSSLQTGLAFLPLSLGGMLGSSLIARRLQPRVAPGVLVTSALGVATAGMLMLAVAGGQGAYFWQVAPAELLVGIGIGAALMPTFSLATLGVEPQNAGVASALISAAQQLGGGLGVGLLDAVARWAAAHQASLPTAPPSLSAGSAANATAFAGHGWALAAGAGLLAVAALSASRLERISDRASGKGPTRASAG